MSKRIEITRRIEEVRVWLEEGVDDVEKLTTELAAKWNTSTRTVERYMAHAKDLIKNDLTMQETVIQEIRSEIITEEVRNSVLSTLELEARLCAIAEGKLMAEKLVRNKDGEIVRISCLPSHRDIIYAIDRLYRSRGVYKGKVNDKGSLIVNYIVKNEETAKIIQSTAKNNFVG